MVNDHVNSGAGEGGNARRFTKEELELGKKATKVFRICSLIAIFICIGVAIFVFASVPWDTRMPYDGRYNRSGSGIPMQIAMIPCLLVLLGLWRAGKKPDAHHMGGGGRFAVYIFGIGMVLTCVIGQLIMAQGILVAGGYLPG
ncbi:hypothetical protein IRJ34_03580 [Paenarthrobacter sp. GOM3]|uniref:hypothetical protein n=1 Tax=Paenarthrobacter sp. GOM3 TaxID=2782567 RepID=UPI001BA7C8B4|nr:hypothetical protein [Paenarthrobacter sp. GOM3]WOH19418.1 hypothetical protein IRJ34_03580 [Paenarthrobacter sp. GOM3]